MTNLVVFTITFALVFYSTGATFIEGFVNYSSWHLIGAEEFATFHRFISPRIVAFLVAPMLLGTVFSVLMLWFRPRSIPAWTVWLVIALQLVVWASSAMIRGGAGFSDTGVNGFLPGQYSNRRAEIHEKAKT